MTRVSPDTVDELRARARAEAATLPPTEYPKARRNQQVARCKNCSAPIWWRLNPSGKHQPMNYDLVTARPTDVPHAATCAARARQ